MSKFYYSFERQNLHIESERVNKMVSDIKFTIGRSINGKWNEIALNPDEINSLYLKLQRFDKIEFAKNVLANYISNATREDYQELLDNEVALIQIAEDIENRSMENNGELEQEVIAEYIEID